MLCKKCGSEISDTTKFCGVCGTQVEPLEEVSLSEKESEDVSLLSEQAAVETAHENINYDNVSATLESSTTSSVEEAANVVEPIYSTPNGNSKKKSNKFLFIVLGLILAVAAGVTLYLALNKNANGSIERLEKALNNLNANDVRSATIKASVSATVAGTSMDFTGNVKFAKENEDTLNMSLVIDKTLIYDSMALYAKVNKTTADLYVNSTLVDMVGSTSSVTPMWLKYSADLTELNFDDQNLDNSNGKEISDLLGKLDDKHLKYVGKEDNLYVYQLVIDSDLISTLDSKDLEMAKESFEFTDTAELDKDIKINFYVNNKDELVKIVLPLAELAGEESVSKMDFVIEFKDINNTTVTIPEEALKATMDIETYMSEYLSQNYDLSLDNNLDFDADYNF